MYCNVCDVVGGVLYFPYYWKRRISILRAVRLPFLEEAYKNEDIKDSLAVKTLNKYITDATIIMIS